MARLLRLLQAFISNSFRSRRDLFLENLALRKQLVVLAARRPRPRMTASDRMFWVLLKQFWSCWKRPLSGRLPGSISFAVSRWDFYSFDSNPLIVSPQVR